MVFSGGKQKKSLPVTRRSVGLLLLLLAAACQKPPQPTVLSGATMGTRYTVKWRSPTRPLPTEQLRHEIEAVLGRIDQQMSTYRDDSELMRFNRAPAGQWFSVSPELTTVAAAALEVGEQTNGAFDVTVGSLVELWGFGATDQTALPAPEAIAQARQHTGLEKLAVRRQPPALRKTDAMLALDLSALAKGYAVDQVAAVLVNHGVTSFLVEIGGELRAVGSNGHSAGWQVGIEAPTTDRRTVQQIVTLVDAALATSGDYRNYLDHQGQRLSHTLNPTTGRPVTHRLASVSVLANDCLTADALATGLLVMGATVGYDWAEEHGIAALLIQRHDAGWRVRATPAFQQQTTIKRSRP